MYNGSINHADVFSFNGKEVYVAGFIDASKAKAVKINDLNYFTQSRIQGLGMKLWVQLMETTGNQKIFTIPIPVFRSKAIELGEIEVEYDLRKATAYVTYETCINASCPVCNESLDTFDLFEQISCDNCSGSFISEVGETHKECGDLFTIKMSTYHSGHKFSHYKNGATRKIYNQLQSDYQASDEARRVWACLMYIQQYKLQDIKNRMDLIYKSNTKSSIAQAGFILELSNLLKLIENYFRVFGIDWNPRYCKHAAIVIFAGNLLRHVDEKDLELIETHADYISVGDENKVFNLKDWEYKTFKKLKSTFGVRSLVDRDMLIEQLFTIVSERKLIKEINKEMFEKLKADLKKVKVATSLKLFPFAKKILAIPAKATSIKKDSL